MIAWTRIRYRGAQFFRTLWTALQPVDTAYAATRLSPELLRLFQRMARAEQHHGIDVCRKLEARGYDAPDLLAAALLHDVGKTVAPPRMWERVIVVLGEHFLPARAARWSTGEPRGLLRRGFVVRRMHPRWGADLAQQAGASPRTVALIRHHHDPPGDDAELAILQVTENT